MSAVATAQSVRIHVQTPDGRHQWHDVAEDDSIIVGSGQSCRVRLDSKDVASMHCLIRLEEGRLTVRDWYTALGTSLNGERIQQSCTFGPGDEIQIGGYRLTAEFGDLDSEVRSRRSELGARRSEIGDQSAEVGGPSSEVGDLTSAESGERKAESGPASLTLDSRPSTLDSSTTLKQLKLRVTELELENGELRLQAEVWRHVAGDEPADPFDLEMVELMKSEIQQLQHEVAQREARIAELTATARPADEDEDVEPDALLARLEDLLTELQLSDERAATLEDLLRAADEATRAEADERRQLAAWVGDIEARIAEREAEWQAGQEVLQQRIDDLNAERERFGERLKELGSKEGAAVSAQVIESLREEVETLRRKLDTAEEARQTLRAKIDGVEFQNTIEARDRYVEQKMREERLELAQERAAIARERAEITRLKSQVDHNPASEGRALDDATCRVQAFREHLKDLHQEESKERESKKLSTRLARLWKRLDGN